MTQSTRPRPVDPYADKNPFPAERYRPVELPSLSDLRSRVPEPIFPEHPLWIELYWRAWELAWKNLHRPTKENGLPFNYLDGSLDGHLRMWDSAACAHYGIYGRRAFDFMSGLSNIYARQHGDGFICREINLADGQDRYYPFDPNGAGPNVAAWAEWRHFRATGDLERLGWVYWPLLAHHRWLKANRTWPNGLYWATSVSSEMENQARIPGGQTHHGHWTWVDASMQGLLSASLLANMARTLDSQEMANELDRERIQLQQEINGRLWSDAAGFYLDRGPNEAFSPVKSVGAYWGLLTRDLAVGSRLERFLRHLHEENGFKRTHPVPSLSADSPGFEGVEGQRWRGGVWPALNYMLLQGLQATGHVRQAHQIALRHLGQVAQVFERTDTIWEYYSADQGRQGIDARADFVGPSGLSAIAIFLEHVIGLSVDWPQRRVTWNRLFASEQGYGVRNYPLGNDGQLDMWADQERLTVRTTVPFTLNLAGEGTSLQVAVRTGESEIAL